MTLSAHSLTRPVRCFLKGAGVGTNPVPALGNGAAGALVLRDRRRGTGRRFSGLCEAGAVLPAEA